MKRILIFWEWKRDLVCNLVGALFLYWGWSCSNAKPNDTTMYTLMMWTTGVFIFCELSMIFQFCKGAFWEYEEELKRLCRIIRVLCWRKGKRFKIVSLCALPFLFSLPCFAVSWQCGLLVSLFACMVSVCMLGGITAWRNDARPVSLIAGSMGLVYAYAMIRTLSETFEVFSLGDVSDVLSWVFMGQFFVALVVGTVAMFIADK